VAGARPRREWRTGVEALTPSELRVARLAAEGQTNREIAHTLYVTLKTVEGHLARGYAKLGITGRAELPHALGPKRPGCLPHGEDPAGSATVRLVNPRGRPNVIHPTAACAVAGNGRDKARGSSLVTGHGGRAGWREAHVAAGQPAVEEKEARS